MTSLAQKLTGIVGEAFAASGLPSALGQVRVSDRPDLAQFQCNGAMAAAKEAKKNPRAVAEEIIKALGGRSEFTKFEIAGPGFININVTDEFIAAHLSNLDDRFGITQTKPETVILDYGGPNIAKPMHVGHLRSAVIGDSLRRIMSAAGYHVLGDVHMGDWGTHMGMLIADYLREDNAGTVFLNHDTTRSDDVQRLMNDMAERYPRAAAAAKENPDLMREAHHATLMLQEKQQPYIGIWQIIRDVSIAGMKKNYDALGVRFDLWKGESDAHDYIAPMVDGLKAQGLAVESEGAIVISVTEETDKKEIPPLILHKSDGAVMYGTTDLATIVQRVQDYDPAKIIYVVDQRQSLHFEQVFRATHKGSLVQPSVELTHAGFGTVNGTDGKPFKTRAGGVMRLEDLLVMALEKARARMVEAHLAEDMSADEREDVAHKVAIAAIKFADLQNQRQSDYMFDLDRMTMFEGKTGPYLLYQAVRIKSLLRKAAEQKFAPGALAIQEIDRPLALMLAELPDHFAVALAQYTPHVLCDYAFRLAQEFSRFYGACHILSEPDAALRASRLALCDLTVRQLDLVLSLLGIEVPERM